MIDYELIGPEDGPRVVATHGAFVDRSEFAAQLRVLRRCRVLLWDMPEHGRSGGRFTYDGAVDALIALLDQLRWSKARFVGHSLGGNVSQSVVLRRPDLVRALFAFDCTSNTLPLTPAEYATMAVAPWYVNSVPYEMVQQQTINGGARSQTGRRYLREKLAALPRDRYTRIVTEALRAIEPLPFYRTPVPLQIAIGRHDHVACISLTAPRWAAREPGARFDILEGAGHCANLDAPDAFNALLARFITEAA